MDITEEQRRDIRHNCASFAEVVRLHVSEGGPHDMRTRCTDVADLATSFEELYTNYMDWDGPSVLSLVFAPGSSSRHVLRHVPTPENFDEDPRAVLFAFANAAGVETKRFGKAISPLLDQTYVGWLFLTEGWMLHADDNASGTDLTWDEVQAVADHRLVYQHPHRQEVRLCLVLAGTVDTPQFNHVTRIRGTHGKADVVQTKADDETYRGHLMEALAILHIACLIELGRIPAP